MRVKYSNIYTYNIYNLTNVKASHHNVFLDKYIYIFLNKIHLFIYLVVVQLLCLKALDFPVCLFLFVFLFNESVVFLTGHSPGYCG